MLFTVLAWIMAFWSTINLLDYFLRSFRAPIYMSFVERYELIVTLFQIRFVPLRLPYTILNALVQSNLLSHLLTIWLTIGIISAIFCSFGITLYLSRSFMIEISSWWFEYFHSFASDGSVMNVYQMESAIIKKKFAEEDEGLKFVIPGWDIPWTQVPLYVGILLIAAVIHEIGHMLAAVSTNVPITSMGFIILAVYFGAYVEIDTAAVRRLSPMQKLRISCAGVWHNLVLALFAWILYESTSFIVSPLYISDSGVYIENIQKDSPLSGPLGLQKGNVIQEINGCSVNNINDWNRCLKTMKYSNSGFCVPDDVIAENIANEMQLVENELDCCRNSTWSNSASHVCFYVRDWMHNFPEERNHELLEYFSAKICACLSARYVADLPSCSSTDDCTNTNRTLGTIQSSCVFPALLGNMSFMRISIGNVSRIVLYVGYIKELEFDVELSNYAPLLPISSALIPYFIELMAKYLFTFSFAFAVINATPCIYLDGQYICSNFVDFMFSKLRPRRRRLVKRVVLIYGTILLAVNFILALWKLYKHAI
uniref:Membrane-bound transcription factor site-2 protease n=1 Tax=Elaeophora elaphi TaxID=1147741 RepID=A0A0R3RWI1_9BILA